MNGARLCGWVRGLWALGLTVVASASAGAQEVSIVLRVETLQVGAGTMRWRFGATTGTAAEFEVERRGDMNAGVTWQVDTDARIESVGEGEFLAVVPWTSQAAGFFRVRRGAGDPPGPAPRFSEVMSDNKAAFAAPSGAFLDWIELVNPWDEAISMEGWRLEEADGSTAFWSFPQVMLQPGGHLLVFGEGAVPGAGALQAGFGWSSAGETLVLRDPKGRERDRVVVPPLGVDQSVARLGNDASAWAVRSGTQVTPGRPNPTDETGVVVDPPEVSHESGFFESPFVVRLIAPGAGGVVRYTTNGTPVQSMSAAGSEVSVTHSMVVRAVVVDAAGRWSREVVRSFLRGAWPGLPVISLAASPTNFAFRDGYLYGLGPTVVDARGRVLQNYPYSGSNAWKDREAEVSLEFLETNRTTVLRQRAGLSVFGGWGSRGYPQKSFAVFARREYGDGRFDHEIFPGLGVDRFESFVLRNSGNDNQSTHQTPPQTAITAFGPTRSYGSYFVNSRYTLMRDALLQQLTAGMGLDVQAYRPSVLYVNGDYWGLYNLREKFNEQYVVDHHEVPSGSVDLIEGYGEVRAGDAVAYRAMRDFVSTRSMAVESNYQTVARVHLEIDNFIDYNLAVLYFQNFDIGNIKCWRPRVSGGRFRWMLYDQDYGFGLWPAEVYEEAMARDYADYRNMFRFATAGTGTSTGWPNAGGRTLLLRRLLENPGFRQRFIRRCTDLLNGPFRAETVVPQIAQMAGGIRGEMPRHLERWTWDSLVARGFDLPHQAEIPRFAVEAWEGNVASLVDYARVRPARLRADCAEHFGGLGGTGTLEVRTEPPLAGEVQVNTLRVSETPWRGIYFAALTNRLVAVARPGFHFVGWDGDGGDSPVLDVVAQAGGVGVRTALFAADPVPAAPDRRLTVSEINYHSPDDLEAGDWIELINTADADLDLTGWVLRDGLDDRAQVLWEGTLAAGARMVLARHPARFQLAHPGVRVAGALAFGLDNGGDTVRLYDPQGRLSLEVRFTDSAPWPAEADGQGATLQRVDGASDPSQASGWKASEKRGGTPGAP